MIDYHIHPDFSIDAQQYSINDYCEQALKRNLQEICFTPHFEFDAKRKHLDWFVRLNGRKVSIFSNWLEDYFYQIDKARNTYQPLGLRVKAGLEVGYDLGLEGAISKIVENNPFDFILGSIHCVDHIAISSATESKQYYLETTLQEVGRKYFHTVLEGVKSGLFDVLGHLDIYRRHGRQVYGNQVDFVHEEYIQPILKEMAKRKIGLEINTSSLGVGQKEFYPSCAILKMAQRAGVSIYTVGSDAHRIQDLGRGVLDAIHLLQQMGLSPTIFTARKPSSKD